MSDSPGENAVVAVAARFFPGGTAESVGGRSWLVSVGNEEERFSVRQLDPGLPSSKIELIHEFLARPELRNATRLVKHEGAGSASFDARLWSEGQPAGPSLPGDDWQTLHLPSSVDLQGLGEIASALGAFHRSGTSESLVARAPKFRVDARLSSVRRSIELDERALAGEIRKESRAKRWLTTSRSLLANATPALEQVGYLRDEPLTIAHLDLWGSHIVVGSGEIDFLDFGSIAAAPQIVDLAQFIARNGNWTDVIVEQVLNHYADAYAIPPLQRRVLPWLTALDAMVSCGRLLARASGERNPLSDTDRRLVFAAADQQLELLQALAAAFVPSPTRRNKRYRPSTSRSRS